MLLLIAAPRGWGAMRVSQRRYLSVMAWVEHLRASRLIAGLLTSRSAAHEVRVHGVGRFLLRHYRNMAESAETEATRLAKDKAATELLAAALSGVAAEQYGHGAGAGNGAVPRQAGAAGGDGLPVDTTAEEPV